jgi:hypothetical protein
MRFSLHSKALLAVLLPLAALACSSNGGNTGGSGGSGGSGTGATGGSGGSTTTAPTGGGGSGGAGGSTTMECKGPGYGGMEKTLTVGTVKATVLDQDGKPAADVPVFVCGTDLCTPPAKTGANGTAALTWGKDLKAPAFKYGDGLDWAKFAAPVPAGDTTIDMTTVLKLAPLGTGDALKAGSSAKSNGVVIDVPAGSTVTVDELTYDDPSKAGFRALLVPAGAAVAAVDKALNLEIVVGAAPIETTFCPPAKVHVPNTPKWPAGAKVEFFLHGLDAGQEWAPYGGWAKFADGAVSADGSEVVTADGQGMPLLSTFGVALKK